MKNKSCVMIFVFLVCVWVLYLWAKHEGDMSLFMPDAATEEIGSDSQVEQETDQDPEQETESELEQLVLQGESDPDEVLDYFLEDYIDAEQYYKEHGTVLSLYSVSDSSCVQTEKQFISFLEERDLECFDLYYEYDMDGQYCSKEVSDLDEKHPIYSAVYIAENNDFWVINVTNGVIIANPVSFNFQSDLHAQLVFAESEVVMCYDGPSNRFFEVIPDENELIVCKIECINAKTLNELTVKKINEMVKDKEME